MLRLHVGCTGRTISVLAFSYRKEYPVSKVRVHLKLVLLPTTLGRIALSCAFINSFLVTGSPAVVSDSYIRASSLRR